MVVPVTKEPATGKFVVGMPQLLNPTIRMLRFGYLFNERTQSMIKMSDALASKDL